jgi:hypothetical protein
MVLCVLRTLLAVALMSGAAASQALAVGPTFFKLKTRELVTALGCMNRLPAEVGNGLQNLEDR